MLAQFALFFLALLGITALVIDVGYVSLTHTEMQVAADSAALEGMRQRDALGDVARRAAASQFVSLSFSDPDPNDPRQPGAGPEWTSSGGFTGLNATQTVSVPNLH